MATALKTPPTGMTGAVRSLQWTIQDLNGSVEHLGQSHDHLRRAQNIMVWTVAIFGALLLSGLVWIANDIFHLKDQMTDANRRFDGVEAQMTALGTRIDDLNITIEQIGAELLAARDASAPATGPDVSVLSTPTDPAGATTADAAAQPAADPQQAAATTVPATTAVTAEAVEAAAAPEPPTVAPSPPAPRNELTPEEIATPSPVVVAATPAAEQPAAEQPAAAAEQTQAAAPADQAAATTAAEPVAAEATAEPETAEVVAEAQAAEAPAAPAPAPAADLSDDQLLAYDDDQVNPADELLLLDENGNPQ